ncbi:MAG TPA: phosphoribosylamine--glycine ligase family protein, partial [Marmoricola sp.]|nr:phosphoribosylamine--glycine ligase family protein [Marmoricola sp.]
MRTLVIGSGGREHAICLALAKDRGAEVHAAPGNPGMAEVAQIHDVDPMDPTQVADLAERIEADLVVVGPEA